MRLLNVTLTNFMPFKGTMTMKFPGSRERNMVLIFGDNMRGKTSILNALRWVFYGKSWGRQLRPVKSKDLINWDAFQEGDCRCEVIVQFEADGHKYDLRRIVRAKELVISPQKEDDFDRVVGLQKDGIVVSGDRIDHELNQIIPEQISRFFLFDGELLQEYEVLLAPETEQGQRIKEAIEQVLGVPALINGRNELQVLLKKARALQAKETKQIERLSALSEEQEKLATEMDSYDRDKEALEAKQQVLKKEIERLDSELSSASAVLKYKARMDALIEERDNLQSQEEDLMEGKLDHLSEAWRDILQPRIRTKILDLEKTRDSYRMQIEKVGNLKGTINNLEALLKKSVCPICDQRISGDHREKIGAELGRLQGEMSSLSDQTKTIGAVSSELEKLRRISPSGGVDRIVFAEKELNRVSVKITGVENEIETLKEKIKGHDTAELARKRSLHDHSLRELGKLDNDIQSAEKKIEDNNRKQNQLATMISRDPAGKNQLGSKQVEIISSLERIFAEGIDRLRNELRKSVAEYATKAFKQITTEKTYVRLDINSNYGLTIIDKNGRDVSERSAGAEQVVALALIDGLNRTARKTGPIVMDTPLGRLDPSHRKNLLMYIPHMAEQVILLVHEGEISKGEVIDSVKERIGASYEIERVSSSQSRIIKS